MKKEINKFHLREITKCHNSNLNKNRELTNYNESIDKDNIFNINIKLKYNKLLIESPQNSPEFIFDYAYTKIDYQKFDSNIFTKIKNIRILNLFKNKLNYEILSFHKKKYNF